MEKFDCFMPDSFVERFLTASLPFASGLAAYDFLQGQKIPNFTPVIGSALVAAVVFGLMNPDKNISKSVHQGLIDKNNKFLST